MSPFSRRLRKLEASRQMASDALPPLVYNVLDASGMSSGHYLIAGKRYGELRRLTQTEVASLERARRSGS